MTSPPPLTSLNVLELAGLAPGPFTGMLLADAGASVLRIDRPHPQAHTSAPPPPTADVLARRKRSIALDLKNTRSVFLFRRLIKHADVLIDPYRPGVLEKLSLGPQELLKINPRLIIARITGYRRTGKYSAMAGHDINYLAVSGALSLLGEHQQRPSPPMNILGDFAGGGHVAFTGILMALLHRGRTGRGQVVEANMVDGAAYLATFPRVHEKTPMGSGERGTNLLDGGAPFYGCYETKDGKWMSVGALEPQFFAELLKGLGLSREEWSEAKRMDKRNWAQLRKILGDSFRSKERAEWERVFDGTDACVAPVLENREMEERGYDQRPLVGLTESPLRAVSTRAGGQGAGTKDEGWRPASLAPGFGGEEVLRDWLGWTKGKEYEVDRGTLVARDKANL